MPKKTSKYIEVQKLFPDHARAARVHIATGKVLRWVMDFTDEEMAGLISKLQNRVKTN